MRTAAEHLNAAFADQVKTFAAELDERARDRFPVVMAEALAAHGVPRDGMSAREGAFADAILNGMLQILGEIVGLSLRRSTDLLIEAMSRAQIGFPAEG